MIKSIHDVKFFWEENPLFTGEAQTKEGTKEFFS